MDYEPAAILVLLVGMLVIFAIDRIRMEVVALGGLAIGLALGLVSPAEAFTGFSSPAFITVLEILLIVKVLGRSGLVDPLARRILDVTTTETGTLAALCLVTASISVFMNNIGALALMLPVVTSLCRMSGLDPRRMLMPVSFAALLGGLCSIIGTPANLIVSDQLAAATGRGFAFFDFARVGIPAAIAGIAVMLVWRPSLPARPSGDSRLPPQAARMVVSEVRVGTGSPLAGKSVAKSGLDIKAMRRAGANLFHKRPDTRIEPGDILLIHIALPDLEVLLANGLATLPGSAHHSSGGDRVEAVVMPESTIVGSRIATLELFTSRGIDIVAVAARTPRIEGSLDDIQLSIGDVLYLAGEQDAIDDAVDEAELMALRPTPAMDASEPRWTPSLVFAAGIVLAAFDLMPPQLAFGLVVLVLAITGSLNLRRGIAELDWSILIMLAVMIPLGLAVEKTGAAAMLATGLTALLPSTGPLALSSAMLLLAVAITPFVNNASTALVLGPIAIGLAGALGVAPEPLLIAVALGASIDFLTPIGHHNNTIVMGLAGYRFSDFLKAGWPVTVFVAITANIGISIFWT